MYRHMMADAREPLLSFSGKSEFVFEVILILDEILAVQCCCLLWLYY